MNEILKKCVEELAKESPRLDYIRGMLDTVLAMSEPPKDAYLKADGNGKVHVIVPQQELQDVMQADEASIMDAKARAAIKAVQEMGTLE